MKETRPDTAIVNVPLTKRGDIDAQLDAHLLEERRRANEERRERARKEREAKPRASALLQEHGQLLAERTAKNLGCTVREVREHLKSMATWEPLRLIALLERFAKEQEL